MKEIRAEEYFSIGFQLGKSNYWEIFLNFLIYVVLCVFASITVVGGLSGFLTQNWVFVPVETMTSLLIASLFIFVAYYFSIPAMQFGEISFVQPFRFTLMIWAIIFGFLFFNEIPDLLSSLGLVIIVLAGIFTYFREAGSSKIKLQTKN